MRTHAIARAGLLVLAVRLAGVAVRYLVQPDGSLGARLMMFVPAALYHAGVLLLIASVFVAVATLVPVARRVVAVLACALFAVLMIAGQLDLTLSWITGEPLTPTVFRTFRGLYIVRSSEFLDPLRMNLPL